MSSESNPACGVGHQSGSAHDELERVRVHRGRDGTLYAELAWDDGTPRMAVCFAPDTDPAYVEDFMRTMMLQEHGAWPRPQGPDYQLGGSWNALPATPRQLSWSFVPDGLTIPSYGLGNQGPSNLFATLDSQFAAHGGRATWVRYFMNVFARWSEVSGLTYRRITFGGNPWDDGATFDTANGSTTRGDVRLSMRLLDGSGGVLAFNFFPAGGAGGNMVLDSGDGWGGNTGNSHRFLRNVLSHEHGHGVGIAHVCPANGTKLMEPFLTTAFDGPQHDDNRAVVFSYGDPYEPNNTAGTASALGTIIQGMPLTTADDAPAALTGGAQANLSTMALETDAQVDWYRFSTNAAATVTVTVIPVGFIYDDNPQSGSNCPSGNPINSAAVANLNVELYSGGGTTLLASGNTQPAGGTETMVAPVPAAGEYHIRVLEASAATQSQLYRLEIAVSGGSTANSGPTANADTYTVLEDGHLTVDRPGVLSNDTDPQGQRLTCSLVGNMSVAQGVLNFSATGLFDYAPAQNFHGAATFQYRCSDGALTSMTATATINVTPVNDAPSFVAGPNQSVNEDSGAQNAVNWATAISPGPANETGQTVWFTVTNTNNALFTDQPAVSPTGTLTYTPAPNAFGSATVAVRVSDDGGTANGGVSTSANQTFTITVNSVNDAPSFTGGANQTVNEDSGLRIVANWATNLSRGASNEATQALTFSATNDNNALFTTQPAVSSAGTLTFTPATNRFGTASVTVVLLDNGGTANGGQDASAPFVFTVTVDPINDAPSFAVGANQTVNEDAGLQTVVAWATSISPGPFETQGLTFEVVSNSNAGLFEVAPAVSALGALTYAAGADAFGSALIQIRLRDDGGTANGGVDVSGTLSFTITVNAVNDAPAFVGGASQIVLEDSGTTTVTGWATGLSVGPPNESTQGLSFEVTANTNTSLFSVQPAVNATGRLSFTVAANQNGAATVTLRARDTGGTANGGVDASAPFTFTISVTPVNDPPTFIPGADPTRAEDSGPATLPGWATSISAGPPDESGQTLEFQIVANSNPGLFGDGPVISPTGTLTFTPASNANGSAILQVRLVDDGGTANGGQTTSVTRTFHVNVTSVNDAPVLQPIGDQSVSVGNGLNFGAIATDPNDIPPNAIAYSLDPGAPAGATIDPATGSFDWTPGPGDVGPHTVTIRATDNGAPNLSDFETITVTVSPSSRVVAGTVGLFSWLGALSEPLITIEIRAVGSTTALQTEVLNLSAAGEFSFATSLPEGSYDVTAKGSRWLRAKLSGVTLGPTGISGLAFPELIPGDIVENNAIDVDDFLALASTYEIEPPSVAEADLNGDGSINIDDFLLLSAAYDTGGAE